MMDTANRGTVTPLYLESGKRRLFGIFHAPHPARRPRGSFIYLPPFAEEMNLARRMAALQARALAAEGVGVLLLDLFGTGDSGGDFCDARWELWIDDILTATDWLEDRGQAQVGLWGLRLGGLLAAAVTADRPDRFKRLLLWQPISDGRSMLTQFLRIRVAASMGKAGGGETTDGLRAELAEKRTIEVAGYNLAAELVRALDTIRMDGLDFHRGGHVDWFQVGPGKDDRLGAAAERVVDAWRRKGVSVSAMSIAGEQFWVVPEAETVTELISATTRSVEACPPQ
jgi:exosortase A-associated hydrolase 2